MQSHPRSTIFHLNEPIIMPWKLDAEFLQHTFLFFIATVQVLICFGPGMIAYSSSLLVGTVPLAAVVLALPARNLRWKGQTKNGCP